MDENRLVVLDCAVQLSGALLHGNLHEESREQGPSDVVVVVLILKGR